MKRDLNRMWRDIRFETFLGSAVLIFTCIFWVLATCFITIYLLISQHEIDFRPSLAIIFVLPFVISWVFYTKKKLELACIVGSLLGSILMSSIDFYSDKSDKCNFGFDPIFGLGVVVGSIAIGHILKWIAKIVVHVVEKSKQAFSFG